jgi:hypothetical protein
MKIRIITNSDHLFTITSQPFENCIFESKRRMEGEKLTV